MPNELIYLDYNATTPIHPEVAEAMKPFIDLYFGNPSSSHAYGVQSKLAIEKARVQLASLLNCAPEEIIFTSGGSESNNYAIKGYAFANAYKGKHLITTAIEHPAVSEVFAYLAQKGFEVTVLPVTQDGVVEPSSLQKALRPDTILVSIMHANNEVGVIQPIAQLAALAHATGAAFHCDGAQSVGKIETRVDALGVDMLSIAAHKFYGPKGIGALYVKKGIVLEKLIHGANHERNRRAGTENLLEIVGLGKAAEVALRDLKKNGQHMAAMRDLFESKLKLQLPSLVINGAKALRLPNTSSVSIPKVEANLLLDELDHIAASAGAACHTDDIEVSSVLKAMVVPLEIAMGTLRFSTGIHTTQADIEKASQSFITAVKRFSSDEVEKPVFIPFDGVVKLTHYTSGGGCACKLKPQDLEEVLKNIPISTDPKVLVGAETSDDAAVYKLTNDLALVKTLDFFTPIVDDPFYFGAIAATNALSDIYAMGAQPIFALNIVGFPEKRLPLSVLEQILKGAQSKADEAGISILGGHSIQDNEPKYGMVVSGLVHPDKILRNVGAHEGDVLVLTKSIGVGIISSAIKKGAVDAQLNDYVTKLMSTLNKTAAEIMLQYQVHACTDVTGFGLMGHLREMVLNTSMGVQLESEKVKVIPEAHTLALAGYIPGGTINNQKFVAKEVDWPASMSDLQQLILCDAQTSGGLLIAVAANDAQTMILQMQQAGVDAHAIGTFSNAWAGRIQVV